MTTHYKEAPMRVGLIGQIRQCGGCQQRFVVSNLFRLYCRRQCRVMAKRARREARRQ